MKAAEHGVKIDFLLTGEYPGDGKPKPVAFPDPGVAGIETDPYPYRVLALPRLIELKLASGMTAPHRLHDLADVMSLIRAASIPRDFAGELHPYVREKFWGCTPLHRRLLRMGAVPTAESG